MLQQWMSIDHSILFVGYSKSVVEFISILIFYVRNTDYMQRRWEDLENLLLNLQRRRLLKIAHLEMLTFP